MTTPTAQFDPRYRLAPPRHDPHPALMRQADQIVAQQLEIMRAIPGRPGNMSWFEEFLTGQAALPKRPLVGYFCQTVPVEMIRAAGAVPIQLGCGNPALAQRGEEILTGEICPLVKGSYGSFLETDSRANRCVALIVPTSCDAKRKLGELLSDHLPTFMLNLPPELDARAYGAFAAKELERMGEFLNAQLGVRITRQALRQELEASNHRAQLLRVIMDERAAQPAALSFRDAQLVIQALAVGADPEEWLRQTEAVLAHLRAFQPGRPRLGARVVLTGAPLLWPNFKLLNLIEECGADIVTDTLCSGFQSAIEPIRYDEVGRTALLRALASRYIFSSLCPCFISQSSRLSRILDLVAELKADCVIHYGLRLCPLFDMEVTRMARILRDRGIPFTNLRTDYSLEDTEQLRVRLEAFLETVGDGL